MPTLSSELYEKQVHLVIQCKAIELLAETFQAQVVSHNTQRTKSNAPLYTFGRRYTRFAVS